MIDGGDDVLVCVLVGVWGRYVRGGMATVTSSDHPDCAVCMSAWSEDWRGFMA